MRAKWLAISLLLILVGCLPIELSVSSNGEQVLIPRQEGYFVFNLLTGKTRLLFAPPEGKPAFALYSRDGKSVLTVSQVGSGMMRGVGFKLNILTRKDNEPQATDLVDVTNLTYVQWSPDKKFISYTRVSDNIVPPMEENLPELYIVNTETAQRRKMASNGSILHRWFPDSQAILAMKLHAKTNDIYQASLVKIDLPGETAKTNVLAEILCGSDMYIDLSADGKYALITAFDASPTGSKPDLPTTDQPKQKLYNINLEDGTITALNREVRYAVFSPDGKQILLGITKENGVELEVTDAAFNTFKRIATDAALSVGESFTDSTSIYPSWIDNTKVLYLAKQAVYGTAGTNLQLIELNADGSKSKNLQSAIDKGVHEVRGR